MTCVSFLTWLLYLFNGVGIGSVSWGTSIFLTGFQVVIYWWMIKNLKGVGMSKIWRIKYQAGSFFSFLPIKTYVTFCSCYSCFSRNYTNRAIPWIKLMSALLFQILWILKYFLSIDHLTSSVWTQLIFWSDNKF